MRLYSVEGNTQKLDGGAMFGNAPKALWTRWASADDLNRIDLACRALLIEDGDRLILCEAGVGAFFEPKLRDRFGIQEPEHRLLVNLKALGFEPGDITDIVLSHLHFDHAGGLLSAYEEGKPPSLVFPKARYIVGARALERAIHPHSRDKASFIPELPGLLKETGRLVVISDGDPSPLGSRYRFHFSEGHTPGLMLMEVQGEGGKSVVFMGDLVPGVPWVHVPITMGYDRFPERLIDEKEALLGDLADRGGCAFFTHDPTCAMATIVRDERGRMSTAEPREELKALEF